MTDEVRMSNRQIERLLDQQTEHLTEYISLALKPILDQTTKTNGRVTALETKPADAILAKKVEDQGKSIVDLQKYVWLGVIMFLGGWGIFIALLSSGHFIKVTL